MKFFALIMLISLTSVGCSKTVPVENVEAAATPIPPARLYVGSTVAGAWTPAVTGAGVANQRGTVTISHRTITENNVGMVRFNDAWGTKEVEVDLGVLDAANDFGYSGANGNGSIMLQADTLNYPYSGGAYPVLTSFRVDTGSGTVEYVNVKAACAIQGMWVCPAGLCTANSNCTVETAGAGSSFFNRDDWDQHQFMNNGYTSVNTFPRSDSTINAWGSPAAMNTLPSGHYYAKYLLMSDRGSSVASATATLRVKVTTKKDTAARNTGPSNGAINLNVILVGSRNINDSHTAKGQQNLNLLFEEVNNILAADTSVSLGDIKVYEWRDADGGDYYSQVNYTQVGVMFASGSSATDAANPGVAALSDGDAVNVFMVRDITISGVSYSILGISGGILGPVFNGTQSSGVVFSTNISNDGIATYNPSCTLASCSRNSRENDFLEMGATIAHEIGHYLGLNHPTENTTGTQRHDQLTDTPKAARRTLASSTVLDQRSCYQDVTNTMGGVACSTACDAEINGAVPGGKYFEVANTGYTPNNFCPVALECQFNHVMWYTTKNRKNNASTGNVWQEDGNRFSAQSSALIQWNPFVR